MILSLAAQLAAEDVSPYSAHFSYASESEPHLGGDNFDIASIRIDHGTGRAEIAQIRAFGEILALEYFDIEEPQKPALPTIQPAPPELTNPPPPLIEGQGPVGIAAQGENLLSLDVRSNEPTDPTRMRVDTAWIDFYKDLRARAGTKISDGKKGVYLQLRAREAHLSWSEALKLEAADVKKDPILSRLLNAPFAFILIGAEETLADLNPLLQLKSGESQQFTLNDRLFIVTRYDLP